MTLEPSVHVKGLHVGRSRYPHLGRDMTGQRSALNFASKTEVSQITVLVPARPRH